MSGRDTDLVVWLIARQGGPTKDEQPSLARPDKPLPRPAGFDGQSTAVMADAHADCARGRSGLA